MGQTQTKNKRILDYEEQRRILLDDVAKVENEIKNLGKVNNSPNDLAEDNEEQVKVSSHKKVEVKGFKWPDPDPGGDIKEGLMVDDVSRMNTTAVRRIFMVRSIEDVRLVLELARGEGVAVSMRGTKHSMGGHTIAENGYVMDMARMDHMEYNQETSCVKLGPGALWSQVVFYLNRFGMSPRTLQSYSTFSVGGSLSVNAHGITSDDSVQESVMSLTVVKWDGSQVICKRDGEEKELFSLVLGGYGMFGVIVEVEMKVEPNVHLWSDMIDCSLEEFPTLYESLLSSEDVNIKLGRIDTVTGERCQIFIFRRQTPLGLKTVSDLPLAPRQMSRSSQLIYKWILPGGKILRSLIENTAYKALDWSEENERNQLIYESCEPLARLYSPFHELEDTFILQEFFIPQNMFSSWIANTKQIISGKYEDVTLLNCTVRFVKEDKTTLLSYSRSSKGSYAFVLYYRLKKTPEADKVLEGLHNKLAEISINLGGTFYLPYRHHYSPDQLKRAYPRISNFFEKKLQHDPHGLFRSKWSDHYMEEILPDLHYSPFVVSASSDRGDVRDVVDKSFELRIVSQHRHDSYRRLMNDPVRRQEFLQLFFKNIFKIESYEKLRSLIVKAVLDPRNKTDSDIYQCLVDDLEKRDGPLNQISKLWSSITQIRRQRGELYNETITILHRLGYLGNINGFVSIGDTGKLVRRLTESRAVGGKVWVVHDSLGGLAEMLERESEEEVGEFVFLDYKTPTTLDIPDQSADLISLNQGLHHFPQDTIIPFLKEVARVLKSGGLFIVREHNAVESLIPSLDLAHSIFNVVTGVSQVEEREEIRAFRPLIEWRKIVESVGLQDSLLYDMEDGDPTYDEMMCFVKGNLRSHEDRSTNQDLGGCVVSGQARAGNTLNGKIETLAKNLPNITLEVGKNFVKKMLELVRNIERGLTSTSLGLTSGQTFLIQQLTSQILSPAIEMLEATQPYLEEAKLRETDLDLLPDELFILIRGLQRRAEDKNATTTEIALAAIIKDVNDFFLSVENKSEGEDNYRQRVDVTREEIQRLIEKLLTAQPSLTDLDNLARSDFNKSTKLFITSNLGGNGNKLDAKLITDAVYPYLDQYSWRKIEPAFEEIIQNPGSHKFLYKNMTDNGSPWHHATMGLLSSRKVKFTGFGTTLAGAVGLGSLIDMWKVAQRIRETEDKPEQQGHIDVKNSLSSKAKNMLETATNLLLHDVENEETSTESLLRCLKLSGLITRRGLSGEYTYYKLVEWLQVEFVEIFGASMHNVPWYRFPFGEMMRKYFEVLFEEMKVVHSKHGFVKAGLSKAFMTDLVPGIVMSIILGQLATLALPLRIVLGDEYSEDSQATQYEEVILASKYGWEDTEDIVATSLVPGLYILRVPSLGNFTEAMINIAHKENNCKILTISSHTEVQVKVSVKTRQESEITKLRLELEQMAGVKVMFDYRLPVTGTQEDRRTHLCLCVQVPHLLHLIREIQQPTQSSPPQNNIFQIEQIYDFWN